MGIRSILSDRMRQNPLLHWLTVLMVALCIQAFLSGAVVLEEFSVFLNTYGFGPTVTGILYVGLCWLLNKVWVVLSAPRESMLQTLLQCVIAAIFAVISVWGIFFEYNLPLRFTDMLDQMYSKFSFCLACFGGMLFYFILLRLIERMDLLLEKMPSRKSTLLETFFGTHLFRNSALLVTVCWLPAYVARFPGIMVYDGWHSLAMHYGYTAQTTHHPLIWQVLMGELTNLGIAVGISWMAPLAICLLHYVVGVLVVAYVVKSVKQLGFGQYFQLGVLLYFCLQPMTYMYLTTVYNDFLFSMGILLLTTELAFYLLDRKTFFSGVHHWVLSFVAVLSTMLRYTGLYVMLVLIAVVGLRELVLLCKRKSKLMRSAAVVLLLVVPLLSGQMIQRGLNEAYNAKSISSRAVLAMPIQQSVRCLIEHGDEIPRDVYEDIHAVLTWTDEEYAEKYNPRNFDDVKASFKIDATKKELVDFVKAWLQLVVRYPGTCIMATANQTYYVFSLLAENVRYYKGHTIHGTMAMKDYGMDTSQYMLHNDLLEGIAHLYWVLQDHILPGIPGIGLLENQGAFTLLLVGICLSVLFRKDRRTLVLTVTLLVIAGITVIGPAVYDHPRYWMPLMYSMPIVLAAYLYRQPETEETV